MADDYEKLEEAFGGRMIGAIRRAWNPSLHPRDRLGRFKDVNKAILNMPVGGSRNLADVIDDAPNISQAVIYRTPRGWEIRAATRSGPIGVNITPEQMANDPQIMDRMLMAANNADPFSEYVRSRCPHCNQISNGGFLPGHELMPEPDVDGVPQEVGEDKKIGLLRRIIKETKATGLRQGMKDWNEFYAGRNAPEGSPEREAWRKWQDEVAVAASVPPPTVAELARQIFDITPKQPKIKGDLLNQALNRAAEQDKPQYIYYDTERGGFIPPQSRPRFAGEGMNENGNLILRGTVDRAGNFRSWDPGDAHRKPAGGEAAYVRTIFNTEAPRTFGRSETPPEVPNGPVSMEEIDQEIKDLTELEKVARDELANLNPSGGQEDLLAQKNRERLTGRIRRSQQRRQELELAKVEVSEGREPTYVAVKPVDYKAIETSIHDLEAKNKLLGVSEDPAVQREIAANDVIIQGLQAQVSPEVLSVDVAEVRGVFADASIEKRVEIAQALPESVREQLRSPMDEQKYADMPSVAADRERQTQREMLAALDAVEPPQEADADAPGTDGQPVGVDVKTFAEETVRGLERLYLEDPIDELPPEDGKKSREDQLKDLESELEDKNAVLANLEKRRDDAKAKLPKGKKVGTHTLDEITKTKNEIFEIEQKQQELSMRKFAGQMLTDEEIYETVENVEFDKRVDFADRLDVASNNALDDLRETFAAHWEKVTGKVLTKKELKYEHNTQSMRDFVRRNSDKLGADAVDEFTSDSFQHDYKRRVWGIVHDSIERQINAIDTYQNERRGINPSKGGKVLPQPRPRRGSIPTPENLEMIKDTNMRVIIVDGQLRLTRGVDANGNTTGSAAGVSVRNDGRIIMVDMRQRPTSEGGGPAQPVLLFRNEGRIPWLPQNADMQTRMELTDERDDNGDFVFDDDTGDRKTIWTEIPGDESLGDGQNFVLTDDGGANVQANLTARQIGEFRTTDGALNEIERQVVAHAEKRIDAKSPTRARIRYINKLLENYDPENSDHEKMRVSDRDPNQRKANAKKGKTVREWRDELAKLQQKDNKNVTDYGNDLNGRIASEKKLLQEMESNLENNTSSVSQSLQKARIYDQRRLVAKLEEDRNSTVLNQEENLQDKSARLQSEITRLEQRIADPHFADFDVASLEGELESKQKQFEDAGGIPGIGVKNSDGSEDPDIKKNLDETTPPEFALFNLDNTAMRNPNLYVIPEEQRSEFLDMVIPSAFAAYADTPEADRQRLFVYEDTVNGYFFSSVHPRFYRIYKASDRPRVLAMVDGEHHAVIYGGDSLQRRSNADFVFARKREGGRVLGGERQLDVSMREDTDHTNMFDVTLDSWASHSESYNNPNFGHYVTRDVLNEDGTPKLNENGTTVREQVWEPAPILNRQRVNVSSNGPGYERTLAEQHAGLVSQRDAHAAAVEASKAEIKRIKDQPHLRNKDKLVADQEKLLEQNERLLKHATEQVAAASQDINERKNFDENGPEKLERDIAISQGIRNAITSATELQQSLDIRKTVQVYLNDDGTFEFDSNKYDSTRNRVATVSGGKDNANPQTNWKNDDVKLVHEEAAYPFLARMHDLFNVEVRPNAVGRDTYYLTSNAIQRFYPDTMGNSPENIRIFDPAVHHIEKLDNGDYQVSVDHETNPNGAHRTIGNFQDLDAAFRAVYATEMNAMNKRLGSSVLMPLDNDSLNWRINDEKRLVATPSPLLGIDGEYRAFRYVRSTPDGGMEQRFRVSRYRSGSDVGIEHEDHAGLPDAIADIENRIQQGYTPSRDTKISWEAGNEEGIVNGSADYNGNVAEYQITANDSGEYIYKERKYSTFGKAEEVAIANENNRRAGLDNAEAGTPAVTEIPRPFHIRPTEKPMGKKDPSQSRGSGGSVRGRKSAKAQAEAELVKTPDTMVRAWSPENMADVERLFGGLDHDGLVALLSGKTDTALISYDYETTGGFGKVNGRKPVQLGATKTVNGVVTKFNIWMQPPPGMLLDDFNRRRPLNPDDPNSEMITVTDEWISTQVSREEAHRLFADFVGDGKTVMLAHNGHTFDDEILQDHFALSGISKPNIVASVDSMVLARRLHGDDRYPEQYKVRGFDKNGNPIVVVKLDVLSKSYDVQHENAHTADEDAAATHEMFLKMMNAAGAAGIPSNRFVGMTPRARDIANHEEATLRRDDIDDPDTPPLESAPIKRAITRAEEIVSAEPGETTRIGEIDYVASTMGLPLSVAEARKAAKALSPFPGHANWGERKKDGVVVTDGRHLSLAEAINLDHKWLSDWKKNPLPPDAPANMRHIDDIIKSLHGDVVFRGHDGMGGVYIIKSDWPVTIDVEGFDPRTEHYDTKIIHTSEYTGYRSTIYYADEATGEIQEVGRYESDNKPPENIGDLTRESIGRATTGESLFDLVDIDHKMRQQQITQRVDAAVFVDKQKPATADLPNTHTPEIQRHLDYLLDKQEEAVENGTTEEIIKLGRRIARFTELAHLSPGDRDPRDPQQVIRKIDWSGVAGSVSVEHALQTYDARVADDPAKLQKRIDDLNVRAEEASMAGDLAEARRLDRLINGVAQRLESPVENTEQRGSGDLLPGQGMKIGGRFHTEMPDSNDPEFINEVMNDPFGVDDQESGFAMRFGRGRRESMSDDAAQSASSSTTRTIDHLDGAMNSDLRPLRTNVGGAALNKHVYDLLRNGKNGEETNLDSMIDMDDFIDVKSAVLRKENGYVSLTMTRLDGSKVSAYTTERLSPNSYSPWLHRTLAYHGNAELPRAVPAHQLKSVIDDARNGTGTDGPAAAWLSHTSHAVHEVITRRMGITPMHNGFDGHASLRRDEPDLAGHTRIGPDGVPHVTIQSNTLAATPGSPNDPIEVSLHEQLHAMSPALNNAVEVHASGMIGFEEGLVHAYSKHLLPDIQRQMGYQPQNWDKRLDNSPYKSWAIAYENMRLRARMSPDEFYGKLLTTPIDDREDMLRRFADRIPDATEREKYTRDLSREFGVLRGDARPVYPHFVEHYTARPRYKTGQSRVDEGLDWASSVGGGDPLDRFNMPASPRRLDPPELPTSIDDLMEQHTESTYGYWRRRAGLPEMPDGRLPEGRLDSLNYEHFIAHHMREVWDDSPDNAEFGGVAKQNAVERMSGVLEADPDMDRIFNEEVLPLLDEPIYAEDLEGLMYHDWGSLPFELTPDQLDRLGERGPRVERLSLKPTDNDIRELADDIVRLSNGELRSPRTQAYDQEDREHMMAGVRMVALLIKSFKQEGKDLRELLDSLTQQKFGRYMKKKLTLQKRRDLLKDKREFFRAYSNRILDHWAKSSWHQSTSVRLQQIVADEFDIDGGYRPPDLPDLDDPEYGKKMMRSVVRGIYEDTQNMLSESHVDSVVAYRGMVLSSSSSENVPSNKTIAVNMGPLSSWSLSPSIAHGFTARMTGGGVLMVARIPRERIFSLPSAGPGAFSERELVILGGIIEVQAIVAPFAGPA